MAAESIDQPREAILSDAERAQQKLQGEWKYAIDGKNPSQMLELLQGISNDRHLRLFAVACCRNLENNTFEPFLQVAEQYADGIITEDALRGHYAEGQRLRPLADLQFTVARYEILSSAIPYEICRSPLNTRLIAQRTVTLAAISENSSDAVSGQAIDKAETFEVKLLIDIFGNPFGPKREIDPAWFAWQDGIIPKIAQGAYENRSDNNQLDNHRLEVLADALEDAGCTDQEILIHCRGDGPHVRGCWVLDLLLGKK